MQQYAITKYSHGRRKLNWRLTDYYCKVKILCTFWSSVCVCVYVFLFFFFFFMRLGTNFTTVHEQQLQNLTCQTIFSQSVHTVHCSWTHKFHFSTTFSLKIGLMVLFTHLKIILLQCFSVFNYIQTDRLISSSFVLINRGLNAHVVGVYCVYFLQEFLKLRKGNIFCSLLF